jgi:nucleotide-binding universal stress UspA family protein
MRKLLVPFDGSDNSMRALKYALALAKNQKSLKLHLLTVQPEPEIYGEIQVYVTHERMEELQRKHSTDLLRPAITAAKRAGVSFTSEICVGDTAATIARRAEELGCDGIVMGTRGLGTIGNLVLGSVTTKVVHLSKLPVTLVK